MDPHIHEWLNLIVRWFHLVAGIAWIGSSFYFMWLDSSFSPPKTARDGLDGELWMVHGGHFYLVEKRRVRPGEAPEHLHWFKWEAALTWISGMTLLAIVYYLTGGAYLIDKSVLNIAPGAAVGISVGIIAVSWLIYDGIWQSPMGRAASGAAATALTALLLTGVIYLLTHVFSGRAAFIHVGAVMGTIMVANVWMRILPGQRRMLAAILKGETPDYNHGIRAKRRSTHNSYLTMPVLFTMISNHFPSTYAGSKGWIILILVAGAGALIRHAMIASERGKKWKWAVAAAVPVFIGALVVSAPPKGSSAEDAKKAGITYFTHIAAILHNRCLSCHSSRPTDDVFVQPPGGVVFETAEQVRAMGAQIRNRVVNNKDMPFANKTAMTEEERRTVALWLDAGMP